MFGALDMRLDAMQARPNESTKLSKANERRRMIHWSTRRRGAALFIAMGLVFAGYLWMVAKDEPSPATMQRLLGDKPPACLAWLRTVEGPRGWDDPTDVSGGWVWQYNDWIAPRAWAWWLVWLLGGAAVLGLVLQDDLKTWNKPTRTTTAWALAWLVLVGYQLQIGALRFKTPDATDRVVSLILNHGFTGYFETARLHRHFDELMMAYEGENVRLHAEGHAATHPPGPVIFFWAPMVALTNLPAEYSRRLMDFAASAVHFRIRDMNVAGLLDALVSGELILLLSALVVIPLYGCLSLIVGELWALILSGLGLLCPALLTQTPNLDCIYPTVALTALYFVLRVAKDWSQPIRRGVWAGAIASAGLLMSYGLLAFAMPSGVMLIGSALFGSEILFPNGDDFSRRQRVLGATRFALALSTVLVAFWSCFIAFGHFHLLGSLKLAAAQHHASTGDRPQVPWVFLNLSDFAQGLGLPLAAVSIIGAWPGKGTKPIWLRLNLVFIALWTAVMTLDLSGIVRGEVSRLWLFLMPLAVLGLGVEISRSRISLSWIGLLAAGQGLCCFSILRYWRGFTP